jgi:hypothetical protein
MDMKTLNELLDVPFTLKPRCVSISADLRPTRRIAVLVLLLHQCRGRRANIEQLHVMNWAIRTAESRRFFLEHIQGHRAPDEAVVRYDPSLSRLIALALAEGLVDRVAAPEDEQKELPAGDARNAESKPRSNPYRISLSAKGMTLAEELQKQEDCLVEEREFLSEIGFKVTQDQIHALLYWDI